MNAQEAKAKLDDTPKQDQPAFPTRVDLDPLNQCYLFGITRLEYFAGQVAAGMASITNVDWSTFDNTAPDGFSKAVFDIAEALCRESEKRRKA